MNEDTLRTIGFIVGLLVIGFILLKKFLGIGGIIIFIGVFVLIIVIGVLIISGGGDFKSTPIKPPRKTQYSSKEELKWKIPVCVKADEKEKEEENIKADKEWAEIQKGEAETNKEEILTKAVIPKDTKFNKILNQLKKYPSKPIVRDEKEFENMMYNFLIAKFPNYRIVQQFQTEKGRIDLVIDEKIAIELKLADNRANIRQLFGQIKDYKKVFKKVGIVILDVNALSDLHEYVHDLKKEGVKVITIKGELRRKKTPFLTQKFR